MIKFVKPLINFVKTLINGVISYFREHIAELTTFALKGFIVAVLSLSVLDNVSRTFAYKLSLEWWAKANQYSQIHKYGYQR